MFRNPVRSIPVENKITDWYFCSNFPKQQVRPCCFSFLLLSGKQFRIKDDRIFDSDAATAFLILFNIFP